jgi:hypothetical protein
MAPLSDEHAPDTFFDPAEFFCANADYASAARHLTEGDIYRKAILGLDAAAAVELGRHLAPRGLELQDDDTHWVVIAATEPPPKKDGPPAGPAPTRPLIEESQPLCPICCEPAAPGRETCGSLDCIEELGRRALDDSRRGRR